MDDYTKIEPRIEKIVQGLEKENEQPPRSNAANQTIEVIDFVRKSGAVLFHDELGDGYIAPSGDGTEVFRIRSNSKAFRRWLAYQSHKKFGKPLHTNVMTEATSALEGYAIHEGTMYQLSVRVAFYENQIWYDLGKSAVKIDAKRWEIVPNPPIIFRRFNSQKKQIEPQRGGNLDLLDTHLPRSMKEGQRLIFKISLVTGLIPYIPQTVDAVFGEHGSAKSTAVKVKKDLLDPSEIDEFTPPDNVREFTQALYHHWYLPMGNLTKLPQWMSDCICRASTGSGFSKRELYTDDDDVIYKFIRVVGLNGINLVAEKSDLLDRIILVGELKRIPEEERMEDAVFWESFRIDKPLILGAMFDALSGAIREYDGIKIPRMPRMADFTRWGCAVAKSLGSSYETSFLIAYRENIAMQHHEAIEASPIGTTIMLFMEARESWEGTPSELLEALQDIAASLKLDKDKRFPKNPSWLWRRINEIRVNLQEKGIKCEKDKETDRLIRITKTGENAVSGVHDAQSVSVSQDSSDSNQDSIIPDMNFADALI